jgi:thiamine biosynthesis protein ThiI
MQSSLFNLLIIRYGEIGLKSAKVRRRLEHLLSRRIKQMLERRKIEYDELKLFPTRGRLFLYTSNISSAIEELKKCFGIVSISPAFKVTNERKKICEAALKLAENNFNLNDTFAIRTRRVGAHPFSSQDISAEVGSFILNKFGEKRISVNLSNPKHIFYIEIRDKDTFLFKDIIQGSGGLPYGSQGKLISLISGGIDSPIATWLMMKRGCHIIPLFCDLTPYATRAAYDRLIHVLQKLFQFTPFKHITLYRVPHGYVLQQIKEFIPAKFTCIFCKRIMYQIAEKLAVQLNAKGIVTGNNLGQVASQTLDNLYILNQAVKIPVFQPIIGFDKKETIDLSKNLELYSESTMPVPSCTAVPEYPETHGQLEKFLEIEMEHDFSTLIDDAFQKLETIQIPIP